MFPPITIAVVVGLSSLATSAASAGGGIPVTECQFSQSYGPDTYYEDHRDIGSGFVMYASRSKYGAKVFVANCFSGATLRVSSSAEEMQASGYTQKSMERDVLAASASHEKVTLSKLRQHFSSLGLWTGLRVETVEHCACAAFYPKAKGEKTDWLTRYEHP